MALAIVAQAMRAAEVSDIAPDHLQRLHERGVLEGQQAPSGVWKKARQPLAAQRADARPGQASNSAYRPTEQTS